MRISYLIEENIVRLFRRMSRPICFFIKLKKGDGAKWTSGEKKRIGQ